MLFQRQIGVILLEIDDLLRNLSLEKSDDLLRSKCSLWSFSFLGLTVCFVVEDGVHDSLSQGSDVCVLLLLAGIKRFHEDSLDAYSFFQHQVKIRNLELKIMSFFI